MAHNFDAFVFRRNLKFVIRLQILNKFTKDN